MSANTTHTNRKEKHFKRRYFSKNYLGSAEGSKKWVLCRFRGFRGIYTPFLGTIPRIQVISTVKSVKIDLPANLTFQCIQYTNRENTDFRGFQGPEQGPYGQKACCGPYLGPLKPPKSGVPPQIQDVPYRPLFNVGVEPMPTGGPGLFCTKVPNSDFYSPHKLEFGHFVDFGKFRGKTGPRGFEKSGLFARGVRIFRGFQGPCSIFFRCKKVPFFDHRPVLGYPKIYPFFSCFFMFFRVFSTFLRFELKPFKSTFSQNLAVFSKIGPQMAFFSSKTPPNRGLDPRSDPENP